MNNDLLWTTVHNSGAQSTLYGSKLGRSVVTWNIGGEYQLRKRLSLFGGYTGDAYTDRTGDPYASTGYLGLNYRW
jgi:hypothetical protein